MRITLPDCCLVVLVGASSAGKSTFAARHFAPTEVLSSDRFRAQLRDDPNDQSATSDAFESLNFIARKRLLARRLTVVDATSVHPRDRRQLIALARKCRAPAVALVLDLPEAACQKRNAARTDRCFGPEVVSSHIQALRRSIGGLQQEGFLHQFHLRSEEEVNAVVIERRPGSLASQDGGHSPGMRARCFAGLQRLLPRHALTRAIGRLAACESPWIKRPFIDMFSALYAVDLSEAARPNRADYRSFNDFFTRALRPDARPLPADPLALACPADGAISQSGPIQENCLLQAKGVRYSLDSLAGDLGEGFNGGRFAVIYLAPRNYHRVHAPSAGALAAARAIPGDLFAVNAATESAMQGLFCRNQRLVCRLRTERGDLLIALIGALIAGCITTPWAGPQTPYRQVETCQPNLPLRRGQELGRFQLGSTVILCTPPETADLNELPPGRPVRMGEAIGRWL